MLQRRSFARTSQVGLARALHLGTDSPGADDSFGFLTDVAFGDDSSIYVLDAKLGQVRNFRLDGHLKRIFGSPASADGGFINPISIAVSGRFVRIYDSRLQSLVSYDTSGVYQYTTHLPTLNTPLDIVALDSARVAIASAKNSNGALEIYDARTGQRLQTLLGKFPDGPASDSLSSPTTGRICMGADESLVFLNPFEYEVINVNLRSGELTWATHFDSNILVTESYAFRRSRQVRPQAAILGVACSNNYVVVGYLDRRNLRLFYDFLNARGDPLARLTFMRGETQEFPGFVAGEKGDLLLTYRTKPFSEVFVFRIKPLAKVHVSAN